MIFQSGFWKPASDVRSLQTSVEISHPAFHPWHIPEHPVSSPLLWAPLPCGIPPFPALHHLPCPPLQSPVLLCSGAQLLTFHNTRCLPHLGVCAFLPLGTCRTPTPAAGPSPEFPGSSSPSPGVTRACLCQHLWKWRRCLPFCPEGLSGRMVFFLCFPCSSSDRAGRQGWALGMPFSS